LKEQEEQQIKKEIETLKGQLIEYTERNSSLQKELSSAVDQKQATEEELINCRTSIHEFENHFRKMKSLEQAFTTANENEIF
jgi:chromosome segregation ATPase